MSQQELTATVTELQDLRRMKEELEAEMEAIQGKIKDFMGDREEVTAGAFKVTWKAVTSSRIDGAALKKALPDVAERFMKSSTTRRFVVA